MKTFCLALLLAPALLLAQTKPAPKTAPHHVAPHHAAPAAKAQPEAIIHTSAGDMHCTLFPDKAPIGVANFIGLAKGTKDWTNPVSHAKKHGVPLYDGTIFHRVIPE
ncbi:MAG TPA: peptidylprolyl isomerase, partial [Terriglobales bacterium]|nr:peptidylprolyl isomerase [Terriglobales bacterium]